MEPQQYLELLKAAGENERQQNRAFIEEHLDAIDRSLGVLAMRGIIEDAKAAVNSMLVSGGNES